MFQVDITQEIKNQYAFLKHSHLQPSEIVKFPYWEWMMMLDELKDYIDQEKEARDAEEGDGDYKKSSAKRRRSEGCS